MQYKFQNMLRGKPSYGRRSEIQGYNAVNKLFLFTILFILIISLSGITSISDSYLIGLSISQFSMLLPALLYLSGKKGKIQSGLMLKKPNLLGTLASIVMGFAIIPFISMINSVSMIFVKNVTDSRVTEAIEQYPLWLMLLGVAVVPAVVEELIYRGIYFGTYKKAGTVKGALLAAVLFALMHGNLNQFAYAVVAGFLFAMTAEAGGSIIYTMIIHIIINGVSIVSLYASEHDLKQFGKLAEEKIYGSVSDVFRDLALPVVVGLLIAAAAYYVIARSAYNAEKGKKDYFESGKASQKSSESQKNLQSGNKAENSGKGKIFDAYLISGIVIMAINLILNETL